MKAGVVMLTTNLAQGGAEVQVAQLASELRRRGWDVSVISLLPPSAFEEELQFAGVRVYSLRMKPGRPDPLALWRLVSLLRKLRPQLVHAHMFHANLLARAIRLIYPVPVVISTIHSIAESSRKSETVRHRDLMYRFTDWLSDMTVCISEAVAQQYASIRAVSPRRLRVILNAVDTNRFRPDAARRASTRKEFGIGDRFVWLAAGRLMWKKGYRMMLQAMARQSGPLLLLAGEGPDEEELRSLAYELEANVRFLGACNDMAALANASDGLLLSSVIEGLPVILLEAAASGLPCVAMDVGGVREAIIHGQTGYVVPLADLNLFAGAMQQLAALPAPERLQMGQAARDLAVARFDLPVIAGQWEQLYRELLSKAGFPIEDYAGR